MGKMFLRTVSGVDVVVVVVVVVVFHLQCQFINSSNVFGFLFCSIALSNALCDLFQQRPRVPETISRTM